MAVTTSRDVVRRLALNWDVTATYYDSDPADDIKINASIEWARSQGFVASGDVIAVIAGISNREGSTNMLRIVRGT